MQNAGIIELKPVQRPNPSGISTPTSRDNTSCCMKVAIMNMDEKDNEKDIKKAKHDG